jgi:hypothetical protein
MNSSVYLEHWIFTSHKQKMKGSTKWVPNAKDWHIKIFVTVNRIAVHNVKIFTEAQLYIHNILQAVTSIGSSSVKEISFSETLKKTNS